MGRVSRRHQAKRRRWREAGVAERKLDTSFWLASGGDLADDASWAGDDRGASDDDDAVDAFLLGANPDGAPDPDDDSGGSEDDADSWAGDGRNGGSDDDMWGVCEDEDGDAASASDPDSDSSDDAWAREWARRLSTDETSPRGASTESGAEEARLLWRGGGDAPVARGEEEARRRADPFATCSVYGKASGAGVERRRRETTRATRERRASDAAREERRDKSKNRQLQRCTRLARRREEARRD